MAWQKQKSPSSLSKNEPCQTSSQCLTDRRIRIASHGEPSLVCLTKQRLILLWAFASCSNVPTRRDVLLHLRVSCCPRRSKLLDQLCIAAVAFQRGRLGVSRPDQQWRLGVFRIWSRQTPNLVGSRSSSPSGPGCFTSTRKSDQMNVNAHRAYKTFVKVLAKTRSVLRAVMFGDSTVSGAVIALEPFQFLGAEPLANPHFASHPMRKRAHHSLANDSVTNPADYPRPPL